MKTKKTNKHGAVFVLFVVASNASYIYLYLSIKGQERQKQNCLRSGRLSPMHCDVLP